ncbi:MAG: P-loop NTPase [Parvularcula sp.]|jgi:ATP-binding protein involved in chromosome partitioning|nr:P-loop NTPase [Parvularcula sp.]
MSIRRAREALRKGRAETKIRQALASRSLKGDVQLRALDGRMTATIILEGRISGGDEQGLKDELARAGGVDRVTIVESEHAAASASSPPAPPKPARRPLGGHADPLHLGAKPQERQGPSRPQGVRRVVAVASGKGGVGKSTVAARLALALAAKGEKVGLLDLDIHGPSLPVLFPAEGKLTAEDGKIVPLDKEGLRLVSIGYMVDERKAVAWRGPMVMNAARQLIDDVAWGELDTLVVDTPPGTGDAHLSLLQRLKIDGAVLVATPSPLALADVRRGAALFAQVGAPVLGIVLNMSGGALGADLPPALIEELGVPILERLPFDPALARAPLSAAEDSRALSALADEVLKALGLNQGDRS